MNFLSSLKRVSKQTFESLKDSVLPTPAKRRRDDEETAPQGNKQQKRMKVGLKRLGLSKITNLQPVIDMHSIKSAGRPALCHRLHEAS